MAYEINIHVGKDGKLTSDVEPFEISVYRESKRVKLLFEVDSEIDSTYHYLKFTHKSATYLYRVHNNEFEIPKAITAYEGAWEMSFVACDEVANSDSTITANYIYASEPIVATVLKGNLGLNDLENIAMAHPGVIKTYALQAGRELRVIVGADKISDKDTELLSYDIAKKIQDEMTYPGQVKITVIRETRAISYAK